MSVLDGKVSFGTIGGWDILKAEVWSNCDIEIWYVQVWHENRCISRAEINTVYQVLESTADDANIIDSTLSPHSTITVIPTTI